MGVVEHGDTVKEMANKDIAGIDADEIGPAGKVRGDILMDEIEGSDGDCKEKGCLGELEGSDKEQTTRA